MLRAGTFYLNETILLTPQDSGLNMTSLAFEHVVINGGVRVEPLTWESAALHDARLPLGAQGMISVACCRIGA